MSADAPQLRTSQVAVFYGATLAIAATWAALADGGAARLVRAPTTGAVAWAVEALLVAAALIGGSALAERLWPAMRRLTEELAALLGPIDSRTALVWALCSGVAEEALFRGPLQDLVGWIAAAALFGLAHGGLTPRLIAWSSFALVAGLALGGLVERHDSLWPAALAHVVVNAVNLRRLGARQESPAPEEPSP